MFFMSFKIMVLNSLAEETGFVLYLMGVKALIHLFL